MNSVPTKSGTDAPARPARSSAGLAIRRLFRFAAWTSRSYLAYMVERQTTTDIAARRRIAAEHTHRWFAGGAAISGVEFRYEGDLPTPPALLVPNHLGYLDILAIGAVCPALFVARADVERWPIVGHLFKSSEQVGISRSNRRSVAGVNDKIVERFDAGVCVCVFLEGTSSGGNHVMPFHASLVQPAIDRAVPLIPIGLRWETTAPNTTVADDVAYWKKDHVFGAHLWRVMGLRGVRVTVGFGQPIPSAGMDRKAAAAIARAQAARLAALPLSDS